MRLLFGLAAASLLFLSGPANALEYSLPKHSILCGDEQSMHEAWQAIQRDDMQWLGGLPACLFTNQPLKAQRIECESSFCKIRFWAPTGQSAIGYTLRNALR